MVHLQLKNSKGKQVSHPALPIPSPVPQGPLLEAISNYNIFAYYPNNIQKYVHLQLTRLYCTLENVFKE
jgi:hypothetical protein